MDMPPTQTKTSAISKTGTALLMIASLAAIGGLTFAVFYLSGGEGGGGGQTNGPTPVTAFSIESIGGGSGTAPSAYMLRDVTSAELSGALNPPLQVQIAANGTVLGTVRGQLGSSTFVDGAALTSNAQLTLRQPTPIAQVKKSNMLSWLIRPAWAQVFVHESFDVVLTSTDGTTTRNVSACVPPSILSSGPYYFDTFGQSYADAPLTQWLCITNNPGWFKANAVTSASSSRRNTGFIFLEKSLSYNNQEILGRIAPNGKFNRNEVSAKLPDSFFSKIVPTAHAQVACAFTPDPFTVSYGSTTLAGSSGSSVTFQSQNVTVTSDCGSVTICLPNGRTGDRFYVGTNGTTYRDVHLTQLARSCR